MTECFPGHFGAIKMTQRCCMFWVFSSGLIRLLIAQENEGSVFFISCMMILFNVPYIYPYLDLKAKRFGSFNLIMSVKNRLIEGYAEISPSKIVDEKLKENAIKKVLQKLAFRKKFRILLRLRTFGLMLQFP